MRYKILLIVLCSALMLLQYRVWFDAGGMRDVRRLKRELTLQLQQNEYMRQQNQLLLAQIHDLKTNQDALDARARSELGMIKKGERFYQIVKRHPDSGKKV